MKRGIMFVLASIAFLLLNTFAAMAHGPESESEDHGEENIDTEGGFQLADSITKNSLTYLSIGATILTLLILFSLYYKPKKEKLKLAIFILICLSVIIPTVYLASSTVYLNIISKTKGPVHWHADYEVWACNEKLDLIDPKGLSNRIGSSTLHEHGDDRMHVEGVVVNLEDVDLESYFETLGGDIHHDKLIYPTKDGLKMFSNGDSCPDGEIGNVKVYVNGKRVSEPEGYIISPYSKVPPGDCIIINFSPGDADTSDKVCSSWRAEGWNYENMDQLIMEYKENDEE